MPKTKGEENKTICEVGTLISDTGKLGVVTRILKTGALQTEFSLIKWRVNYEICYLDGDIQIIGEGTLGKLIEQGIIVLLQ